MKKGRREHAELSTMQYSTLISDKHYPNKLICTTCQLEYDVDEITAYEIWLATISETEKIMNDVDAFSTLDETSEHDDDIDDMDDIVLAANDDLSELLENIPDPSTFEDADVPPLYSQQPSDQLPQHPSTNTQSYPYPYPTATTTITPTATTNTVMTTTSDIPSDVSSTKKQNKKIPIIIVITFTIIAVLFGICGPFKFTPFDNETSIKNDNQFL